MLSQKDKYTITIAGVKQEDGPSFLKALLMKCYVETNATDFYIRDRLSELPNKMTELKHDIGAFNDYVSEQVTDLAAGGGELTDLFVYLFKAYLVVKDRDFVEYMKRKKEAYDEGTLVSPTELMDLALTKYKQRTQANEWCTPTEEEKQIVALAAQLQQAKSTIANLKKGRQSRSDNKSSSTSRSDTDKDKDKADQSWKKQKPRPGQKTRKYKGETYTWCEHHKMWTNHDVDTCRAKKKADAQKATEKKDKEDTATKGGKALELAQALVTIVKDSDSDQE